ncbi:MAG: bifunctional aspartate kinase/homoserine dehydrogenase I [Bacteroidia bacterium]|nr:bifunctional aspartate kinase/homoserine dehydrogenase I [Bacteroidia bacterium]
MKVLKFGGTSVAQAENLTKVAAIILKTVKTDPAIVVVSAMSGITDALIQTGKLAEAGDIAYKAGIEKITQQHLIAAQQLLPAQMLSSTLSQIQMQCNALEQLYDGVFLLKELSARTLDHIVSFGELMLSQILSAKLHSIHLSHQWIDSRTLIETNDNFGYATVNFENTNAKVKAAIKAETKLYVMPGFIASTATGITTTLGRGGSDYTAAIYAAAVNASVLEIWTDVSGMLTADPRIVNNAKVIQQVSYHEALELSHFGAKVIYPPTIVPVMRLGMPLIIKNTFAPDDAGTIIQAHKSATNNAICGITSMDKMAMLLLEGSGMVGIPGFSKRLFEVLAFAKINVILITQSSSEHSICVAIESKYASHAKKVVDEAFHYEILTKLIEPLQIEQSLSIVAVVGDNMKNHSGISGRMFAALGRNGINIRAIAQGSSEKNISAVIKTHDVRKAINVLHESFFENQYKQVNLFLVGVGNVGKRLIEQIKLQQTFLMQKMRIQLRVVAVANSKQYYFSEDGIDLDNCLSTLLAQPASNIKELQKLIIEKNLRNSIFVDNTANAEVGLSYAHLLEKSISVVTSNKIACASAYEHYRQLKDLANEFHASFLFETNVGAGLPVISTLNDLVQSGDEIYNIQAVLSGTLNYVFNNYNAEIPFAQVVKQAQDLGLTEPDPRLDLSGMDVMRKILILARESGLILELGAIENNSFLPPSCMNGSVDDFYAQLEIHEPHFKKLYNDAKQAACKLKFVAQLNAGKASVGLQHIDAGHDLYHLYGKDNVVLFYSRRYQEQPLVVKGAGAGAEVTASGVFADIVRAIKFNY